MVSILNGRNFTTAGNFSNDGFLDVGAGSIFTVTGVFTHSGALVVDGDLFAATTAIPVGKALSGIGRVHGNLLVYGTLNPGDSPGTISILGDYTQEPGSALQIEIDGTGAAEFDHVDVTGNVYLYGDLDVLLYGTSYQPHTGDLFDILDWTGTRAGEFAHTSFPDLGAGYSWDVQRGDHSLTLELEGNGNPGAVPEPGSLFLLAGGLLLCAGRVLRRSARNRGTA
jgi:subtilase-type serine protease